MHKTLLALFIVGWFFIETSMVEAYDKIDETNSPKADAEFVDEAGAPEEPLTLWYRKPALIWESQALPIGNGRLAAMVYGGVNNERIQFNEETLWEGVPLEQNNPCLLYTSDAADE